MARRILVAVDASEASRRAAEFTNEFFGDMPVEILVLNVAPPPVPWYPALGYGVVAPYAWPQPFLAGEMVPDDGSGAEDLERHGKHVVEESGIEEDEVLVEVGDPVDVIRRAAETHDVDLVVVGTNDKGWWARLLEGSVSDELLRHGRRPVLVVR